MSAADPFGLVGQVLDGQFRVDKLVGEGGFSVVYRGHHQGLNEPIAIKCLKLPSSLGTMLVDTFVQRFRDESRILYRLSQGNLHIVRSIAAGTTQAPATGALVPYMVLEWLEGRSMQNDFTVRRTIGNAGRSLEEVQKLFEPAADGLGYAHAQGVVHRDLNPGNLFLAATAQGQKMKVLDFGVAKLMHDGALNLGPRQQTVGQIKIFAPAYGAPEQFDDRIGAVGAASDVYAFALIVLEALRDRSVNEGAHLGEFAQTTCDPSRRPTPRALGIEVPDEVEAAFARATALDPLARWQSAADFWQSLTIAMKFATERRYQNAAHETAPLAMGAPAPPSDDRPAATNDVPTAPPVAAAPEKPQHARTMPLGAVNPNMLRPAGVPRPRVATTIGIPLPAAGGVKAAPADAAPAASSVAGATIPRPPTPAAAIPRPPTPAVGLSAPTAPARTTARPPPGAGAPVSPALPPTTPPLAAQPDGGDYSAPYTMADEDEDEATKVHAPAPEILRTLAMQDVLAARTAADDAAAQERAKRAPPMHSMPTSGGGPTDEASALAVAARAGGGGKLGGTMMMAPMPPKPSAQGAPEIPAPPPPKGAMNATMAMAPPVMRTTPGVAFAPAPPAPAPPAPPPPPQHAGPVQSAPGMQGIAGAHGTPPQGVPAVSPLGYGQTSALVAPVNAPSLNAPAQNAFVQGAQMSGAPPRPAEVPFAPPSFVQSSGQPAPAMDAPPKPLPVVPIVIVLALLALGGIGLGAFALLGRRPAVTDPSALTSGTITPVPVPMPVESTTAAEPTATVTAAVPPETSAAPPVAAPDDSSIAAANSAPPASASAAPAVTTAATTAAPPTATFAPAPTFVAPTPTPKPSADPNAFSESAARSRLGLANGVLAFCKKEGGVTGPGTASVTFSSDGSVAGVALDPPYAGTKEGDCVSGQFRRAKVNAFTGAPQTVRHSFEVPK